MQPSSGGPGCRQGSEGGGRCGPFRRVLPIYAHYIYICVLYGNTGCTHVHVNKPSPAQWNPFPALAETHGCQDQPLCTVVGTKQVLLGRLGTLGTHINLGYAPINCQSAWCDLAQEAMPILVSDRQLTKQGQKLSLIAGKSNCSPDAVP